MCLYLRIVSVIALQHIMSSGRMPAVSRNRGKTNNRDDPDEKKVIGILRP
jgi:hypothetical protein